MTEASCFILRLFRSARKAAPLGNMLPESRSLLRPPNLRCFLGALTLCAVVLALAAPAYALDSLLVASYAWRDTFLPCGMPSVALRTNETAMLWNPAGVAMGNPFSAGYAYSSVYAGDDRETGTHFVLTNTRGMGFGFTHDNIGDGTKTRMLFTVAPRFSSRFAVGWTGKWRGGFNFDVGAMMRIGNRISLGFVGRDLRDTRDIRRYYETGAALIITPRRFGVFYNAVIEDNDYRRATAHGGGIYVGFEGSVFFMGTLTDDGEGHTYFRFTLQLYSPSGLIEGAYMTSTDDFRSLSGRISRWSPQ